MTKLTIIESLAQATQQATTELIIRIFPYENPDIPRRSLELSVNIEKHKEAIKNLGGTLDRHHWVARQEDKIVGTIGYYVLLKDELEASWLSWYCVAPEARNQGIGSKLLEIVIAHIKASGKQYVRVFTSDIPEEKQAQKLYKKIGFVYFREPKFDPASQTNHLYLQLKL